MEAINSFKIYNDLDLSKSLSLNMTCSEKSFKKESLWNAETVNYLKIHNDLDLCKSLSLNVTCPEKSFKKVPLKYGSSKFFKNT